MEFEWDVQRELVAWASERAQDLQDNISQVAETWGKYKAKNERKMFEIYTFHSYKMSSSD